MRQLEVGRGMAGSCGCSETRFDGLSAGYRRVLAVVIAINAVMFFVELGAAVLAGSMALSADALDFLGDTATYGLTLAVIGRPLRVRATAALIKAGSLAVMAGAVLAATFYRATVASVPEETVMTAVGLLALAANLTSALLLLRYRNGDANVRSVWLCSRNDAIGNLAVIAAAIGVAATASPWPDLVVAMAMASVFLASSLSIFRQATAELREAEAASVPAE